MAEVIEGGFSIQNLKQLANLSLADVDLDVGQGGGGMAEGVTLVEGTSGIVYKTMRIPGTYFGSDTDVSLGLDYGKT